MHREEPQGQIAVLPADFLMQTRGPVLKETFFKGKFNRDRLSETNSRCGSQVEEEHPTLVWRKEAGPREEGKYKLGKTESDWECLETSGFHLWFSFLSLFKATNAQ